MCEENVICFQFWIEISKPIKNDLIEMIYYQFDIWILNSQITSTGMKEWNEENQKLICENNKQAIIMESYWTDFEFHSSPDHSTQWHIVKCRINMFLRRFKFLKINKN